MVFPCILWNGKHFAEKIFIPLFTQLQEKKCSLLCRLLFLPQFFLLRSEYWVVSSEAVLMARKKILNKKKDNPVVSWLMTTACSATAFFSLRIFLLFSALHALVEKRSILEGNWEMRKKYIIFFLCAFVPRKGYLRYFFWVSAWKIFIDLFFEKNISCFL